MGAVIGGCHVAADVSEAVWHVVVLISSAAACSVMVVFVFFAFTPSHRSSALQSLRSAFASGDGKRIQEAIWHAAAAGVSAEHAASMQELRACLSEKFQSALADQDMDKLGALLRPVGMTSEEVAFAEKVLTSPEPDTPRLRVIVQRPNSPPVVSMCCGSTSSSTPANETCVWIAAAMNALDSDDLDQACLVSALPAPVALSASLSLCPLQQECLREEPLRELHRAVEAGDAVQLRAAISVAQGAGVDAEEVTLAEAVLQIEVARLQRVGLHGLRQASTCLAGDGAAADELVKMRVAVRAARVAGVDTGELQAAEALLRSAEVRIGTPRRVTVALRSPHRGVTSPKKKVTFAEEDVRIYAGEAQAPAFVWRADI